MKRLAIIALVGILALGLGGCSFDKQEREDAARVAVQLASQRLAAAVVEELVKEGIDPVQAKKVGDVMTRKAAEIADRVIRQVKEE